MAAFQFTDLQCGVQRHGLLQQAQTVGFEALLDFLADCALMTTGIEVGADSPADAVRLATLHGSKGLEFNTVCIVGESTKCICYAGVGPVS